MVLKMKSIIIVPNFCVETIEFGCDRKITRSIFGNDYKEIKKNIYSTNTIDAYSNYHLFFSADNSFIAIELFGDIQIIVNEKVVYPGNVEEIKKMFPEMQYDGYGWIDRSNSLAVTVSQDDENYIESILFGKKNYFVD